MLTSPGGSSSRQISPSRLPDSGLVSGVFHDHRIARHQRRGQVRGREHERMIERHDPRHHAPGLAQREMQPLRRGGHRFTLHLGAEPREVLEISRRDLHIGAELADGVAGIARLELQDLGAAFSNPGRDATQHRSAFPDGTSRPGRLGRLRGCDRSLHVGRRARRHAAGRCFVGRVDRVDPLPARRLAPLAADQHVPVSHRTLSCSPHE
jgi:hypothetical protein